MFISMNPDALNHNDELIFADEENDELLFENEDDELILTEEEAQQPQNSWKVMIVDDEIEIHSVTKLALDDFIFENKKLDFVSAYSGEQAVKVIQSNPDIAMIFLDVVMEHDRAGLDFVKYIRESLGNELVQIVLRTGQPGQVPEKQVIQEYDINDYKTKTELTGIKLFTTVRTNLKTFSALSQERAKSQQLKQILEQLQQTQFQLIQNEKMSAIGQLVAGVAHEINNPVGFINGNIQPAIDYIKDIFGLIDIYQEECFNPSETIQDEIEAIDLEYIREDLPKLIASMQEGTKRINNISNSLRTFSRADTDYKVSFSIHDGLDSTIMILKHRLKASENHPEIKVDKNYGEIPKIECFPGQLNQVFMNLLANAIDALEESNQELSYSQTKDNENCITIATEWDKAEKLVIVRIKDNGIGMSEKVKQRIFDNLYTTKAVGKGTGLGLSIAHQIITQNHQGSIEVNSEVGKGTEFVITIPAYSNPEPKATPLKPN
ncbi:MAG: ATP-binding protein [Cyanobacteria bacterium J06643_5]